MALIKFAGSLRNVLPFAPSLQLTRCSSSFKDCLDRLKQMNVPDKPKKPLTPYFRFLKDYRRDLVGADADLKATQIVKKAATVWAASSDVLKEKYTTEFAKELEGYNAKIADYNNNLTQEQKDMLQEMRNIKIKSKKKKLIKRESRKMNKPKRPIPPYMLYMMEKAQESGAKITDLMHSLPAQYQALSDEEKQKYFQRFEDDRKRYKVEIQNWEKRMIEEGHSNLVRQKSRTTLSSHSRLADSKPKKQ